MKVCTKSNLVEKADGQTDRTTQKRALAQTKSNLKSANIYQCKRLTMKDLEEFIRIEEMEGMEAVVGPELAVVVDDNDDDDVNVDAFEREATDETTSDGALEGGALDGPAGRMNG